MTDIHAASSPIKENFASSEAGCEFIWGAENIGAAIGRNARQAHHLLTQGAIKSAKKIGGRWVALRSALLREFGA